MFNNDSETLCDKMNENQKMNIPNDLSNIKVAGDSADRAKEVKLKLNAKRCRDIYEYLCRENDFQRKYTQWNETHSENIKKENEFYFICKFQEFNVDYDQYIESVVENEKRNNNKSNNTATNNDDINEINSNRNDEKTIDDQFKSDEIQQDEVLDTKPIVINDM